jgi:putative tryptophan/tyrosine transport system substrate-binding protein
VTGDQMVRSSRRRFLQGSLGLTGVSLLAGCGLLPLPGQQSAKAPRIGFLAVGTREGRAFLIEAFLQGLREHGYTEGQNVAIEYRFSEDRDDRLPALARELVDRNVALIVTSGVPASFAARDATATIPVVLGGVAADPVETGLVASLARPGGNITGLSQMSSQASGKRLELLKEVIPGLARVAVFWNPINPVYGPVLKQLEVAAPTLGVELQRLEVRVPEDFGGAFASAIGQHADALLIPGDPLTTNRPGAVADLAVKHRLPAMMEYRVFPEAGGLISFGADIADLYRRSATYVDKILKGTRPADLPVEQASKFDLIINVKVAQALGLTIPASVLQQATEVIQ